ncbi:CbtB domain-containing protein [Nocardioides bruguierae]|uniref:CbtB-domain containing protein n=1 Tax=Nocardioides bruguierae TaxID=2945102 RepID=A0A9X2D8P7_9ACTN|nr:CbtB-domain containing protein [Nocardioides bruguierae]MCL8026947.1 CbtB-domain containing protein [Nocardioides bruguierae]MCM0621348.1 CbtB-domain containing protein [Nocardioides bruguierae]
MSQSTSLAGTTVAGPALAPETVAVPLRELAPWAFFLGLLGLLLLFFVGADQGAVSLPAGSFVHELVHDGRHLLGYPCH